MTIDEIASNAKYQKDEQFQNLTTFWESSSLTVLLIFNFDK